MYDLATDVVDMHMFKAALIEDGKARKMVDGRFMEWKKEWYGNPEVVLPKVFPIRLGRPLSNESPTRDFEYVPLNLVADEIRVLVVVPFAEDESSTIVANLGHCPIKREVYYIALSYRWGTDTATTDIVLNGQKKRIRSNLDGGFFVTACASVGSLSIMQITSLQFSTCLSTISPVISVIDLT